MPTAVVHRHQGLGIGGMGLALFLVDEGRVGRPSNSRTAHSIRGPPIQFVGRPSSSWAAHPTREGGHPLGIPDTHMTILAILISGFLATTVMTIFSYILSRQKSEQFREPELLNSLILRSDRLNIHPPKNGFPGWVVHYSIGWTFVVIFYLVWEYSPISPGIISGLVMGLVAGLVGITGWKIMFDLSGNPPDIHMRQFHIHILVAHVLFGITAASVLFYLPEHI